MSTAAAQPAPASNDAGKLKQFLGPVIGVVIVAVLVIGVGWGAGEPDSLARPDLQGTVEADLRTIGATGVSCPTGIDAKEGASVACTVTFLGGRTQPYDVRYVETKSYGTRGKIILRSTPAG